MLGKILCFFGKHKMKQDGYIGIVTGKTGWLKPYLCCSRKDCTKWAVDRNFN